MIPPYYHFLYAAPAYYITLLTSPTYLPVCGSAHLPLRSAIYAFSRATPLLLLPPWVHGSTASSAAQHYTTILYFLPPACAPACLVRSAALLPGSSFFTWARPRTPPRSTTGFTVSFCWDTRSARLARTFLCCCTPPARTVYTPACRLLLLPLPALRFFSVARTLLPHRFSTYFSLVSATVPAPATTTGLHHHLCGSGSVLVLLRSRLPHTLAPAAHACLSLYLAGSFFYLPLPAFGFKPMPRFSQLPPGCTVFTAHAATWFLLPAARLPAHAGSLLIAPFRCLLLPDCRSCFSYCRFAAHHLLPHAYQWTVGFTPPAQDCLLPRLRSSTRTHRRAVVGSFRLRTLRGFTPVVPARCSVHCYLLLYAHHLYLFLLTTTCTCTQLRFFAAAA